MDKSSKNSLQLKNGITISTAADAKVNDSDLCEFYAREWERPIALSRADFLNWQFSLSPEANGVNNTIVALRNGQLVGALGTTPRSFFQNGNSHKAAELTTWVVAPEARGLGIGTEIIKFLQNRYDFLSGANISSQALPIYLKSGFTFLENLPRFFYVNDFHLLNGIVKLPTAAVSEIVKRQKTSGSTKFHARRCSSGSLNSNAGDNALPQSTRKANYLKWRYDEHPIFKYDVYEVTDPREGIAKTGVILRQDTVNGIPFLHLIDVVGNCLDYSSLVAFLENETRKRRCAFIDAHCSSRILSSTFLASGWSSAIDDPVIDLPNLFHPLEFRQPPTSSLIFWSKENQKWTGDFSDLHFTKGDLDLDRPTLDFYKKISGAKNEHR